MKTRIIASVLFLIAANSFAQQNHRKYFPLGLFHKPNAEITGISVGLFSGMNDKQVNTTTNGLRLEFVGLGVLFPLVPKSPLSENDSLIANSGVEFTEKINGINISGTGTICADCIVNGITIGTVSQYLYASNGATISLLMTVIDRQNGVQLSAFNESHLLKGVQVGVSNYSLFVNGLQVGVIGNYARKIHGIQIGFFNKTANLKGMQVGIWNINQKRKMPFINWNFNQ
ncbi:LA_2272 family surface repeat-containing protein [Pedobacter rhizosphaerae]|uniref:Uncharacterized protein n=1 Tax=Pedobacter rhizosphaerae TaxID=390241 RepID=A0A1H9NMI5_9SPHI|nr:hypothetical protein [Pedobacter rhizosphaerae]SER36855.1 hypothetical protein SAMN04488023_1089 [Pedobacter rhizosphaerae]